MKDFAKSIRTNNSSVCNISADITTDGNTWFVTTSDGKKEEFTSEREAEEYVKKIKAGNRKVGNANVGNSAYDDMRQAKNISESIEGEVKRKGLTPEVRKWANIEIGKINQIADYLENSAKSVRDEANKMKQIVK